MAILAIVDDLLFRSKIEAAASASGASVEIMSAEPAESGDWDSIIVDLNRTTTDALAVVAALRRMAPGALIIGYCSHTQRALQEQAKAAGCSAVLARSEFVQNLPEILAGSFP